MCPRLGNYERSNYSDWTVMMDTQMWTISMKLSNELGVNTIMHVT